MRCPGSCTCSDDPTGTRRHASTDCQSQGSAGTDGVHTVHRHRHAAAAQQEHFCRRSGEPTWGGFCGRKPHGCVQGILWRPANRFIPLAWSQDVRSAYRRMMWRQNASTDLYLWKLSATVRVERPGSGTVSNSTSFTSRGTFCSTTPSRDAAQTC